MKRMYITAMAMLFTVVFTGLTACNPDDEPVTPEAGTPAPGPDPSPENPGDPGNDNDKPGTEISRNISINAGGRSFAATLEDNEAAKAFAALLPMTVTMSEMNGNEKYYYLPGNLPATPYRPGTLRNGDLMLYGSNCVVLFYETFPSAYSYTRLGKIDNPEGLAAALGREDATITFEINKNQ